MGDGSGSDPEQPATNHSTWIDGSDLLLEGVYPSEDFRYVLALAVLLGGVVFALGASVNALVGFLSWNVPQSINYVAGCNSYYVCQFPEWYYVFEWIEVGLLSIGSTWVVIVGNYLSIRYVRIWTEIRSCFRVDAAEYYETVGYWLERSFDGRRILSLFVVVDVVVLALIVALGCTYDAVGISCSAGYVVGAMIGGGMVLDAALHLLRMVVGILYVSIVVFVFVVAGYAIVHFLRLTRAVVRLPIQNIETAAHRLESLARMGLTASAAYFLSVGLLLIYPILRAGMSLDHPFWVTVLAVLTLLGLLIFFGLVEIIHRSLKDAKIDVVQEVHDEFDSLAERAGSADADDSLAAELDLVDRRLQRAEAIPTWPYDLPILGELLLSSLFPSLITALVPALVP